MIFKVYKTPEEKRSCKVTQFTRETIVISYFTSGSTSQTLPITIYSMTRRKVSPEINALSTIVILVIFIAVIIVNVIPKLKRKKVS